MSTVLRRAVATVTLTMVVACVPGANPIPAQDGPDRLLMSGRLAADDQSAAGATVSVTTAPSGDAPVGKANPEEVLAEGRANLEGRFRLVLTHRVLEEQADGQDFVNLSVVAFYSAEMDGRRKRFFTTYGVPVHRAEDGQWTYDGDLEIDMMEIPAQQL